MLIRAPTLVAVLGLLSPAMTTAQAQDYGEWRALSSDEEKARIAGVRLSSVAPAVIEADFDGNGTKDKVSIAIRKADGARGVIALIGKRLQVVEIEKATDALGLADPTSHDTICGKALRELHEEACNDYPARVTLKYCNGYHPARVTLKHPGFLRIGMRRRMFDLVVWDPNKRRFVVPSWIGPSKLLLTTGVFCVDSRRVDPAIAAPTVRPPLHRAERRADLGPAAPRRSGRGLGR
jgi:hypothetical protein